MTDDGLNAPRGMVNGVKFAVLYFWLPLGVAWLIWKALQCQA